MVEWLHKHTLFLLLCFFCLLYIVRGFFLLDPDFGWHIALGEYIMRFGIPTTDPFSYTMPSYPFVDYEWLTNSLITFVYPYIGMLGLSVIFAAIAIGSLYLQLRISKKLWSALVLFLAASTLLQFTAVRPQVITWFFFSLLIALVSSSTFWKKYRILTPVLFLLWANLHGGFAVGFVLLIIMLIDTYFRRKKEFYSDLFIFIACIGGTLVNPYGIGLWQEIWHIMSNSDLRWGISEWQPSFTKALLNYWFFALIGIVGVIRYYKVLPKTQVVLFVIFFLMSISSARHVPLFILASFSLLVNVLYMFSKEAQKYLYGAGRWKAAYRVLVVVAIAFFSFNSFTDLEAIYSSQKENKLLAEGFSYIKSHQVSGNTFTLYGWAGSMLWKIPEKKVFIDGRMPHWRFTASNTQELEYAFQNYMAIISNNKPIQPYIHKYSISTVILPRDDLPERNMNKVSHGLHKQLSGNTEWKRVYSNDLLVIYRRKPTQ